MPTLEITLEDAERIALENNKQVKAVEQLVEKAQQGRLEAFSKWFPKLEALSEAYYTTEEHPIFLHKSQFLSQLSMIQTLFESDVYYGTKIATLMVEQLKLLLDAAVNDTLYNVRSGYYRVILDSQTLGTNQERVELLTNLAQQMQDNYRIGTAILYNVNQTKVAVANSTSVYYDSQKNLRTNTDHLVKVLGFDPGSVVINFPNQEIPVFSIPELATKISKVERIFEALPTDSFLYKPGFPNTEGSLMNDLFSDCEINYWETLALSYRPGLLEGRKRVEIANMIVKSKKGKYLPSLDFHLNYGGFPTPYFYFPSDEFTNQQFDVGAGVSFKWMLFDGLGRERRVQMARSQRQADRYRYEEEVQETYGDVRKQIFEIQEAVATYVTAKGNVELARQTVDQALSQLEVGYITIYDYQIAIDTFVQAKNIRDKARFDLMTAYYGLRHASGADMQGERI